MDPATLQLVCTLVCCLISLLAFVRSGTSTSAIEAKEMGRIEQKIDGLVSDVKEIKKQNLESAKMESQTKERLDTLFKWKDSVDIKLNKLEEINGK